MRSLFTTSLVVAGIFASNVGAAQRRKTLGFGPEHPHKVFKSSPYQIQFAPDLTNPSPFDLARHFVQSQLSDGTDFHIRKDSYTDTRTGVTHVYVRQLVNGIEVADGDMNINIKDGIVLSYGSSVRLSPLSQRRAIDTCLSSIPVRLLPCLNNPIPNWSLFPIRTTVKSLSISSTPHAICLPRSKYPWGF